MTIIEGDLVVVVGQTISKDGPTERHTVLSTVVAVGKRDVFVQKRTSSRIFSVPQSRCIKVASDKVYAGDDVLTPKLGDLVLSMADRFGKSDRKLGVLVEIIDIPGDYLMAKILMGEKSESVLFKSLIVVE
jgi:hypothetical protein